MIKSISVKNFLSFGNKPTIFHFTKGITLILGVNGSGKSTIYDALYFALFGSSFREGKKATLANETNTKGLQVILSLGDHVITRTLSEVAVTDKGASWPQMTQAEMQARIESDIIKCNASYVKQTMILGSTLHTPFFKLPALDRRRVLETLINLTEVSKVEKGVSKRLSDIKKVVEATSTEITALTQRQQSVSRSEAHNNTVKEKQASITNDIKVKAKQALAIKYVSQMAPLLDSELIACSNTLAAARTKIQDNKSYMQGLLAGVCNSCNQPIDEDFRRMTLDAKSVENAALIEKHRECQTKLKSLEQYKVIFEANQENLRQIRELQNSVKYLKSTQESLTFVSVDDLDLDEISKQLTTLEVEYNEAKVKLTACNKILDVIRSGSVRESIMKSVAKKVQTRINDNLFKIGFRGILRFDTDGSETITYRGKERPYSMHSAGEKNRIDLAVMLAMRSYSMQYAGANLGILILDEVADSSLDYDGLTGVLSCLEDDPQCIIIISHHPGSLVESADRVVKVSKDENNFTKVEYE